MDKAAAKANRRDQVAAWCREARALDERAEAILLVFPGTAEILKAHGERPRAVHERTRGPRQLLLREIGVSVARRHPEARRLHRLADARYWEMVQVYEQSQRIDATNKAARWGLSEDDVYQTNRIGWYHAALRFDPARGLTLYTLAQHYVKVELQRSGLLQPAGVHVALTVAAGRNAPKVRTLTFDMPLTEGGSKNTFGSSSDMSLKDLLASDGQMIVTRLGPDAVQVPGEIGHDEARDRTRITAMVATLPDREREVLMRRYLDLSGVPAASLTPDGLQRLSSVGAHMGGLSRERIRQIEVRAVESLRVTFRGPTGVARVPRSRLPAMTA